MMPVITAAELFRLVLAGIILGVIEGIIYDFFRLLRSLIPKKSLLILTKYIPEFLTDIIFFVIVGILNAFMFSAYGGGQVRIIAILGELASLRLYKWGIKWASEKIVAFISKKRKTNEGQK